MNNVRALIVCGVVAAVLATALIVIGLQGQTGLRPGFASSVGSSFRSRPHSWPRR
ncbi:hypothetical protein [Micromonospora sp. AMSO31t]|uniref:hypothetical protein n=1 Tax=Micromonospora sp. AMSO31t TaxID=2650566 RepID=UPI001788D166|nr:hypothetical protein [Micromonospora sp. AMSO31t]